MRKKYNFSKMKKRKSNIMKMVKKELKALSKIQDVSRSIKKLDQIKNKYNKRTNIYKPGSAKYYRDQLTNIRAVAVDYDGYNINSAKQMRELVEDLCIMARDALNHEKLYIQVEEK